MKLTFGTVAKFAGLFLGIFFLSFTLLYIAGVVPVELQTGSDTTPLATLTSPTIPDAKGEEPVRITIASIGVDAPVANPASTNTEVLDAALTHGAVRWPGSGLAGEGNMFLFGHSTGFKVVNNQAYKTFNNIKTLQKGDSITVFSKDKQYLYEVDSVTLVDADKALVELGGTKKMLTLSTCNTFGEKQERHVVVAHFVSAQAITPAS